jgi:hypothetical protein
LMFGMTNVTMSLHANLQNALRSRLAYTLMLSTVFQKSTLGNGFAGSSDQVIVARISYAYARGNLCGKCGVEPTYSVEERKAVERCIGVLELRRMTRRI